VTRLPPPPLGFQELSENSEGPMSRGSTENAKNRVRTAAIDQGGKKGIESATKRKVRQEQEEYRVTRRNEEGHREKKSMKDRGRGTPGRKEGFQRTFRSSGQKRTEGGSGW